MTATERLTAATTAHHEVTQQLLDRLKTAEDTLAGAKAEADHIVDGLAVQLEQATAAIIAELEEMRAAAAHRDGVE